MAERKKTSKQGISPAELEKQHAERMELTAQLEGDLLYTKEAYIGEIKFLLQNAATAMVEAGKRLLVIKEREGYGSFIRIVEEEIGIPKTTAYRFINTAIKAAKFPRINLSQIGTSNIYSLLEAPEEDLKQLEEEGVLAGKTVDELQTMSVKEMRDMIKGLKTDIDKQVKKEAGALKEENKALKKELAEFHKKMPNTVGGDYADEWADTHLMTIEELFIRLDSLLSSLAFDSRLTTSDSLAAKVEGLYRRQEALFIRFVQRWERESGNKVVK